MASQMKRKGEGQTGKVFYVSAINSQLYNDPVLCFKNVKDFLLKEKKN